MQRLKMWQRVCRVHVFFRHELLAVVFGEVRGVVTVQDGQLTPAANPWAKLFRDDLLELDKSEDFLEIARATSEDVLAVFKASLARELFQNADFSVLRARACSVRIPPPGTIDL